MMKVAVQGFAIREELSNDFEGTVRYLTENDFEAYEMGLYFGEEDPRVAEEVIRIREIFGKMPGCIWSAEEAPGKMKYMRDKGLAIESCHLFFATAYDTALTDNLRRMIDFAKANGLKQYVISCVLDSWEAARAVAGQLTEASRAFETEGIHLAYHNHDREMSAAGEKTVLEMLLDHIPTLSLQPDIGWMEAGKGPVERILADYSGRIYSIHFKDLLIGQKSSKGEIICTPIGKGDVDHLSIIPFLGQMPLMETGLVIDQDNARTSMLDELMAGRDFIVENFTGK